MTQNKIQDLEEKLEKSQNALKMWKVWLAFLILFILLALLIPLPDIPSDPSNVWKHRFLRFGYEVRLGLGAGLITLVTVSIVYDLFSRNDDGKRFERGLTRVIGGNPRILDSLNVESKKLFVENSLKSVLGTDTGGALYEDVIKPLVDSGAGYRRQYNYEIEVIDDDLKPEGEGFPSGLKKAILSDEYLWVKESLEYELFDPETKDEVRNEGPYLVVITFDKGSLDEFIRRDDVFFRSLVELNAASREALFSLADDKIESFVIDVLQLRFRDASSNEDVKIASIEVDRIGRKVPVIKVLTQPLPGNSGKSFLGVDLRYPHFKKVTHFTVLLPQPSKDPEFRFRLSRQQKNLSKILYLSNIPDDRVKINDKPNSSHIKINGWVFPTSGVTFTWEQI